MTEKEDALARAIKSVDLAYSQPKPFEQSTQVAIAYALIAICQRLDGVILRLRRLETGR